MKTGCIFFFVFFVIVYYVSAYFFCSIDPNVSYPWYYGIWHGIFWFPNLIMGVFSESIYAKASDVSIGYHIAYYTSAIISSLTISVLKTSIEAYMLKEDN